MIRYDTCPVRVFEACDLATCKCTTPFARFQRGTVPVLILCADGTTPHAIASKKGYF